MKTLLLMRHGKSSWKDSELTDIDRPLNKRGKKDVPEMGKLIRKEKLVPQRILSSPAQRARMSAEAVTGAMKFKGEVEYFDSFYMAEPQVYLEALHGLPDDVKRVMIIGHNPGLEGLLQILSGRIEGLTTAAIACLEFKIDHWSELGNETHGKLVKLWNPRDLRDKDEKKGKK